MVRLTLPDGTVHLCPIADALALIADHPHVGVHTLEVCDVEELFASPTSLPGVEAVPAGLGGTGRDRIAKWTELVRIARLRANEMHDQYLHLIDAQAPTVECAEAYRRWTLFADDLEFAEKRLAVEKAKAAHPAGADL